MTNQLSRSRVNGEVFKFVNWLGTIHKKSRKHIVLKFQSIFWLVKTRIRMRSPGGFIYWKKNLSQMCKFVINWDERLLRSLRLVPIWTKDPFLCIKKDMGVLIVQLVQAEADYEEEEEENIPIANHVQQEREQQSLIPKGRVTHHLLKNKEHSSAQDRWSSKKEKKIVSWGFVRPKKEKVHPELIFIVRNILDHEYLLFPLLNSNYASKISLIGSWIRE